MWEFACTPRACDLLFVCSGGIAALDHRLQAIIPAGMEMRDSIPCD